jgi:hypothetical protein
MQFRIRKSWTRLVHICRIESVVIFTGLFCLFRNFAIIFLSLFIRRRRAQVLVGVDAMDQLLTACHGTPSLNLFVESFLKIVQKLLEEPDPMLEVCLFMYLIAIFIFYKLDSRCTII